MNPNTRINKTQHKEITQLVKNEVKKPAVVDAPRTAPELVVSDDMYK
jgi:hypothetical protein